MKSKKTIAIDVKEDKIIENFIVFFGDKITLTNLDDFLKCMSYSLEKNKDNNENIECVDFSKYYTQCVQPVNIGLEKYIFLTYLIKYARNRINRRIISEKEEKFKFELSSEHLEAVMENTKKYLKGKKALEVTAELFLSLIAYKTKSKGKSPKELTKDFINAYKNESYYKELRIEIIIQTSSFSSSDHCGVYDTLISMLYELFEFTEEEHREIYLRRNFG